MSEHQLDRRDVLKTTGAVTVGAGVTAQTATADIAEGPTVFVGSHDNTVYALDATTGTEQWAFETGDDVVSSPTVVDDPATSNSVDSRVNLGVLGHHHVWAGTDPGTVVGTVTDDEGSPLSGVTVKFLDTADGTTVETTTTDDSGAYEGGLPPGKYEVVVDEFGFESVHAVVTVSMTGETTVHITLVALDPGTLTGTVTDKKGTPLVGIELTCVFEDEVNEMTTTDADGSYEFTLPPATYELTATADGYQDSTNEVTVTEDETTGYDISLSEGPPSLPGQEDQPQDLNENGLYEDIDGDGEFTIFDVQAFFTNFQSETVQSNPAAFNFTEEENPEEVTIFDVQALFQKLS
jgi:protocatechuate 3,4-dioxygenase beta subunit